MAGTDTFDHATHCKSCLQMRNAKYYYFDRMTTKASQLADIRRALEVSGRSQKTTMHRITTMKVMITNLLDYVDGNTDLFHKQWAEEAHRKMFS